MLYIILNIEQRMMKERKKGISNIEYRMSKGKKKNEYRLSKDGAPKARFLLKLKYGAKRRLPSIFGVTCSSFDIPAEGGSFFKRSLEKSVGPSGHLKASLNEPIRQ